MPRARIIEHLTRPKPTLFVSLPTNSAELAQAAIEGGADGLKVHINVHHEASGTHFGSYAEEAPRLEQIVCVAAGLPVGIVPGAEQMASEDDLRALAALGIDFFDAYAHHIPAWMVGRRELDMAAMVALGAGHDWTDAIAVGVDLAAGNGGWVDAIEASVIPHEGYGQPLTALDVARYARLCRTVRVPVMLPTQRRVRPDEVSVLAEAGMSALLIGAVVTGREAATIRQATAEFRAALNAL
jgi:hypothetical protein